MRTLWPEDLGRLVRQRRLDLGLTQGELAARVQVTRQWVSTFESGKADAGLTKAFAVLRELDLVLDIAPRLPAHPITQAAPSSSVDVSESVPQIIASTIDSVDMSSVMRRALQKIGKSIAIPALPPLTSSLMLTPARPLRSEESRAAADDDLR